MRLDKFLKVSRVIKRRTVAKEVCDSGKVYINGRVAKSGTEVKPGDILELNFGSRKLKIRILNTPPSIPANMAKETYLVIEGKDDFSED